MNIANISEEETHLSALIKNVPAGEEVIIEKAGKPFAGLVPYERGNLARRPGALKGKIRIHDDFEELPKDIAEALGAVQP